MHVYEGQFGSFSAITWDTVFRTAGYNSSTGEWARRTGWERQVIDALYRNRASDPTSPEWPRGLRTCYDMARSIGLGYDAPALCARLDPIWPEILAYVEASIAEAEAAKWEEATRADRAVADGGGAVATAADGSMRVECYHTDGTDPTILPAGSACPPGTGGVPPRLMAKLAARPKVLQPLQPVVAPGPSKPVVLGFVVGPDGTGIAGANVQLRQPVVDPGAMVLATSSPSTTTDSSGGFRLEPKPSTYELVVSASGFNEAVFGPITVPATGTVDVGALPLEAVAVLPPPPVECPEGKVLDPVTGGCVAAPVVAKPWYKSPLVWVIGGVVVIGGGYLLLRKKG